MREVIITGVRHGSDKSEIIAGPVSPEEARAVWKALSVSGGKAEKGKGYSHVRWYDAPANGRKFPLKAAGAKKALRPTEAQEEILRLTAAVREAEESGDRQRAQAAKRALADAQAASAAEAREANRARAREDSDRQRAEREEARKRIEDAALAKRGVTPEPETEEADAPQERAAAPELPDAPETLAEEEIGEGSAGSEEGEGLD